MMVPEGIRMEEIKTKTAKKRPAIVVCPGDTNEAAMARFAREHPEYVQAEQDFYWKRDVEQKKKYKEEEEEERAGPSTVILAKSDSSDWGDLEEEDEGCDDLSKDEFWEQLKSFDEE
uniref:Uncharacterized protein n=1 Tax=Hordeum vulgare subsp. vulgare TaxID=112509 RepID=A0A8I6XS71_HORVV